MLRIISYDGYFQEQPLPIVHPLNILLLTNVKVTGLTRTRFILTNRRTGYVGMQVQKIDGKLLLVFQLSSCSSEPLPFPPSFEYTTGPYDKIYNGKQSQKILCLQHAECSPTPKNRPSSYFVISKMNHLYLLIVNYLLRFQ